MKLFSLGVLATVTGLAVGFCLLVLGGRNLIQLIFGLVYKRIMTEHYWTNLFETYNLAKMIGLGPWLKPNCVPPMDNHRPVPFWPSGCGFALEGTLF